MRPAVAYVRNLYRSAFRSIIKKWRQDKKKSSPDHHETKVDQIPFSSINNDVTFEEVGDDIEVDQKKSMHGSHTFRCISLPKSRRSNNDDDPSSPGCFFNHSSLDNMFNRHLSRSSSRRSRTPTPALKKTKSRKSWPDFISSPPTPTKPASGGTKSADSTPAHPSLTKSESRRLNKSLSRTESRRSTTIMFSNSSGLLKPPAVEKQLECTLEELSFGCQKKMKVSRAVVRDTGQMDQEEELVTIQVEPGWKKGTKITFVGLGNERPGVYPADIIFVISEKRHSLFERQGDDLLLALEIPLVKALAGCFLSIPLLGGEQMTLEIKDIIYPGYQKIISGQGMAISQDEEGKRGKLKVTFHVEFPTSLTDEQRLDVVTILEGSENSYEEQRPDELTMLEDSED